MIANALGFALDSVGHASAYALLVNTPYAIALTAVTAEVTWLARRPGPPRRQILASAATAATMGTGAFVVAIAYTGVLRAMWRGVGSLASPTAIAFWRAHALGAWLVAFVAWDAVGWTYHYIGHHSKIGWAAHQPHHSGEAFDATLGLRQSWAPVHGLVPQSLLALAGFDFRVIVVCAAFSNAWQVLEHTSVRFRFPQFFSAWVMTPDAHRQHHGRDGGGVNLGPVFTCWDRLAGTWLPADTPSPSAYGSVVHGSQNPVTIELAGWKQLFGA